LSYSLPETGTRKILYQTAHQAFQKPVPVFWYRTTGFSLRFLLCVSLAVVLTSVVRWIWAQFVPNI